jgi:hypothetical protein
LEYNILEKLKQVISYLLSESSQGRARLDLSKLLYYSDAVFFQHHGEIITGEKYIHTEDSPQPIHFYESLSELICENIIEVKIDIENSKLGSFRLYSKNINYLSLNREEKRIINKVLKAFPAKVLDENKQYPNLYENYVITPIFSEIQINKKSVNTKIHILRKKSVLTLSGKIFRVLYEE